MENIKGALEYALHAFEQLHNTQTYQGDNQDFSDEIITMRQALAELEQATAVEPAMFNTCLSNAKQEPAQAVPVAYTNQKQLEFVADNPGGCVFAMWSKAGYETEIPLYAVPPAIDDETRKLVLELCRNVMQNIASWSLADDAEAILEKLEAGNGE